uniref:Uncharacterized protein n=1 Tax=Kalanchoe fedtschenkoi TaxID=63787 RepID=A0A7N0US63_KALFE
MAGDWRTKVTKVNSFVWKTMGGLSGRSNLASWAVAGSLAYYLWVKPSEKEQQEKQLLLHQYPEGSEAQKSNVLRSKSWNEQ